jgi:phosphoglycolate phosphatase-like HAD superfamily hydrolase
LAVLCADHATVPGYEPLNHVLADVDGTLVDSFAMIWTSHFQALVANLHTYGQGHRAPASLEQFIREVGPYFGIGPYAEMRMALEWYAPELYPRLSLDNDALVAQLEAIQDTLAPTHLKAYSGLDPFLATLAEQGVSLGIITSGLSSFLYRSFGCALPPELGIQDLYSRSDINDSKKMRVLADVMLQHYGFRKFTVVTRTDVVLPKPDAEGALLALARLKANSDEAAMVGDHDSDIRAAVAAKITTRIGVCHPGSICSPDQLRTAGATSVAHSLEEVIGHLFG